MEVELPIEHVIVIGFHHKKGAQIEYAYPPFELDIEKTAWKHLSSITMPDGAHNYTTDTVFFHLPSLRKGSTVFGVACYQQIAAEKVKNKSEEVTRSTVQKSVCVLAKYPLFGHISVKMSLITAAYFREGDFSQVSLLEEAYHNLNACLTPQLLSTPEAFVGLSPRDLIHSFKHEVLLLLKLLLLEKRILFIGASVGPLCSALLTLVSLIPLTLEYGLVESASVKSAATAATLSQNEEDPDEGQVLIERKESKDMRTGFIQGSARYAKNTGGAPAAADVTDEPVVILQSPSLEPSDLSEKGSDDNIPDFVTAIQLTPADAGLPFKIFTNGYLCHPYLSLHYMDLLSDARVRGYIVGATNVLFKQKKDLFDVVVEMQDGSVEVHDPGLRRAVTLTTEDLRFAENIVRNVSQDGGSGGGAEEFMEGVGWEGGDEWIRAQFKYYIVCLMRTSLVDEGGSMSRLRDSFHAPFISAWTQTHHWKCWKGYVDGEERDSPGIYLLSPGHPCSGQISMSDMKLRFAHSMGRSEGGRKIGKAVSSTGKVVGGAINQAKGALSSWWSSVVAVPPGVEMGVEQEDGGGGSSRRKSQWFTS